MIPAGFEPVIPITAQPLGLSPGHFTPRERFGILSWPQGRSGRVHEISHSKDFELRNFQRVASLTKVINEKFVFDFKQYRLCYGKNQNFSTRFNGNFQCKI